MKQEKCDQNYRSRMLRIKNHRKWGEKRCLLSPYYFSLQYNRKDDGRDNGGNAETKVGG